MRALRLLKVGLGVTLGCIAAGAAAAVLCAGVLDLVAGGASRFMSDPELYGIAAIIGGICGLLVGPLAAFGLLRRVPLGRLFVGTALGATLGGILGIALPMGFGLGFLWVAVGGFSVAVTHLAWRYRATREPADRALAGSRGLRV